MALSVENRPLAEHDSLHKIVYNVLNYVYKIKCVHRGCCNAKKAICAKQAIYSKLLCKNTDCPQNSSHIVLLSACGAPWGLADRCKW